eukprot:m.49196 g.49196  ORF g.49196 m.49196 type:complete len:150 (-) comp8948_c0_seq1:13-462(-)
MRTMSRNVTTGVSIISTHVIPLSKPENPIERVATSTTTKAYLYPLSFGRNNKSAWCHMDVEFCCIHAFIFLRFVTIFSSSPLFLIPSTSSRASNNPFFLGLDLAFGLLIVSVTQRLKLKSGTFTGRMRDLLDQSAPNLGIVQSNACGIR